MLLLPCRRLCLLLLRLQDSNQKLQGKLRDAAAGSSASEAQLTSLQDKISKQQ